MKLKSRVRGVLGSRGSAATLFRDYFTIISMVILICFLILGTSLVLFVASYWRGEKAELLSENAYNISKSISDILSSDRMAGDSESAAFMVCSNLRNISQAIDADIFVCNMDGRVIYCQDVIRGGSILFGGSCVIHDSYRLPSSVLRESALHGTYSAVSTLDGTLRERNFVSAVPISAGGNVFGVVVAAQPAMDIIMPYVRALLKMFAVSALVALAIAFVTVYLMTYEMTRPLRQMAAATKKYSEGDFSYRVKVTGENELAQLSQAFNDMARRLATLESSRRSFVANVSHELKTPMTTIGGFIDGILDGTIDEDSRDRYLKIVSDETKRLSRLVTGMLNMSKIEEGELAVRASRFDISEIIFKTFLTFEKRIEERGVEVSGFESIDSLYVTADIDMINQVVYNLVDNALKFTPEGGTVTVGVRREAGNAEVSIRNTGAGISTEDMARIFERFYKADRSRSYDVKGAGLGLYIVKSILILHGGDIKVSSVEGEYTQFTFTLPTERPKDESAEYPDTK